MRRHAAVVGYPITVPGLAPCFLILEIETGNLTQQSSSSSLIHDERTTYDAKCPGQCVGRVEHQWNRFGKAEGCVNEDFVIADA